MGIQVLGFQSRNTGKLTGVGTTSQVYTIPQNAFADATSALITNDTDKTIFVLGSSSSSAVATETGDKVVPVKSGLQAIIAVEAYIAVVALASATGTVYITAGN